MKANADVDVLELIAALRAVPKGLFILAALGAVPMMIGLNALLIRPRFKRMLLEDFAGNDQAIQFINWAVIPENGFGLIVLGLAFTLPMAVAAARALKQQSSPGA